MHTQFAITPPRTHTRTTTSRRPSGFASSGSWYIHLGKTASDQKKNPNTRRKEVGVFPFVSVWGGSQPVTGFFDRKTGSPSFFSISLLFRCIPRNGVREPREAIRIESDRDFEERTELFAIFTSETKNQGIHPTIRPSQTKISILGSAYFLVPLHTNSLLLPTGTVIRPQELQVTGTHRRERRHPYHQTHSIGPASRRTFS